MKLSWVVGITAGWLACLAIDKWGGGVRSWVGSIGGGRTSNPEQGDLYYPDEILGAGQVSNQRRIPPEAEIMLRNLVTAGALVWAETAFTGVGDLVNAATGNYGKKDGDEADDVLSRLKAIHAFTKGVKQ